MIKVYRVWHIHIQIIRSGQIILYETMKSSLYLACFLSWLFKQFQAFVVEMNSRVPVKDCYDDKLGTFSFPVTISGISQNASCFEHCNCNGTAISWQSNFNCEWCCCQNRVLHKEIAPGRFFFLSFISKHYLVSHFRDIHCRFSLANPRKTNSIVKILLLKFHVILN